MTQGKELARQGDIKAIATLLNQKLQPQGITVQTTLIGSCLAIMLESSTIPDSQVWVEFIRQELISWGIEIFDKVRIFGRLTNQNIPVWKLEFDLPKPNKILELAKQGNSQAITDVFNFLLNPHQIYAKATYENGYLYVVLQADGKVPNQKQSIAYVQKLITYLELFSLKRVQVYGWLRGQKSHAWTEQIDLAEYQVTN